ncbi:MAG: hypothetical protein WC758_07540 [Candidatus Woesearchaeota archaeon]|jgi:hypothetical protein
MTKEKKEKRSKEMENILTAIDKWMKKHENQVGFVGTFYAFKEKDNGKDLDVVDDTAIAFGPKELLRDDLKNMDEAIEEEKEDFIIW